MASFSKGTSFTDGVTGDVTAAKLHALVDAATPVAGLVTDRTAETTVASGDQVLIADASDSNTLKKMTVTNLFKTDVSITSGTGTAGTVAIGPTGDTNTGLFFPAADTIAFSEGGTEAMRIDSSGNVGIGANSPTFGSGSGVELSRSGVATFRVTSGGQGVEFRNNAGSAEIDTRGAYPIILSTNQTERLRIDSSGRVGIGTTSPATTYRMSLTGDGSTIVGGLSLTSAGITYIGAPAANSSAFEIWNAADNYVRIGTNATERLRITSGGEVYIAGTTDQGAYNLQVNGTGVWGAGAYVNGSDERLKENIQDIASGLDVVEKLRPVSFQYKQEYTADRSVQSGFIAQDLLVALEGKNYLEGVVSKGPTYYNVAYQNLIPILAKAIQELKAENESLKIRIAALEAA